ncbi:hypothetical protein AGMMS49938_01120 [Fibrobacterales bacterium]|nr:hypothetical protein AGMMS49938_01120 [Fibrobacterales bacterium]
MFKILAGVGLPLAATLCAATPSIQEAAYILAIGGDTAKAKIILENPEIPKSELLTAHLYLAKIAEKNGDSITAARHYKFIKDNAQTPETAYNAALGERKWSTPPKILLSKFPILSNSVHSDLPNIRGANYGKVIPVQAGIQDAQLVTNDSRFSNCINEGELKIALHIVYNCPDNALHIVSKKNGNESWSIPFNEGPAKVFFAFDGVFLYSENSLSFYKLQDGLEMVWRLPTLEVSAIDTQGDKIFVLDISGKISLLQKNSGAVFAETQSDGENFFNAGVGLVGTYQKNGGISAFDSLLNNLWNYQIDGEIYEQPEIRGDSTIFFIADGSVEILNTRIYEKVENLQEFKWDNLEKRVIYGMRKPKLSNAIFGEYAEKIGAKWVRKVPLSSKILYPKIFSDQGSIFILDEETQNLHKFSADGNSMSNVKLPSDRKYTVADVHFPNLMLYTAYKLLKFSLYQPQKQNDILDVSVGKPFSFLWNRDSLYIGLWNGFALKYIAPKNRAMSFEWSRKVSSAPVFLEQGSGGVFALSQGKIYSLNKPSEYNLDLSNVSFFKSKDGVFVVALDNGELHAYSEKENFASLGSFSVNSQIVSLELLNNGGKIFALAGKSDQTLSLYELPSGSPVWTFKSKGSAFLQPLIHGSQIWLDQDKEIVAIEVLSGKVAKRHAILGNGASLHINGNTLYCVTPQKLLYAFQL